jgi:hypothetical protein
MLEKIPRDVALHVGLSWLLSLPTWGVDMDELACPCTVLRPTAARQGDKASYQAPSCSIVQQWVVVLYCGIQSPQAWIFVRVLTAWVPVS